MNKFIVMTAATLIFGGSFVGSFADAHGEDKPGPNGGFIKMPGAFHTEVLQVDKSTLKIFLLDINWKNPTIVNSSVAVRHTSKQKAATMADCSAKKDHYICAFPKTIDVTLAGELQVTAKRENLQGIQVAYELPLKLPAKPQTVDDGHSGHHH